MKGYVHLCILKFTGCGILQLLRNAKDQMLAHMPYYAMHVYCNLVPYSVFFDFQLMVCGGDSFITSVRH